MFVTDLSDLDSCIRRMIGSFPDPYKNQIGRLWDGWVRSNPDEPFYLSWPEYASEMDDGEALYTETRVYIRKITNRLRDAEVPQTVRNRIGRALAAVASLFVLVLLAISRLARAAE